MAADVTVAGATYSDVPAVQLTTSSGGTATFYETSEVVTSVNGSTGDVTVAAADHTHTRAECNDPLASATYTGILRTNATYSSPYTPSYFYFGQAIPTDLDKPSHFTYHIKAYGTSNSNYLLDAEVRWDLSTDGIYKAYHIWNNNNSTSYYPFGYHTLYRSNNATISASDGCYFGGYYGNSKSYGQNPNTLERTFEVEVLEAENCTVTLTDDVIFFDDTDSVPANLVQTSTSEAYNTTNFTVVSITTGTGLQESGDGNTNYYDRMVWGYAVQSAGAESGRYSIGFTNSSGDFVGMAQTSSTGTSKTLNTSVEIDPNLCFYQLTTTYASGATIAASALYSRFNLVDIRYSCNQGSWMTALQPVYIKLSMASSGFFTFASTPFTHTLPTEADGYYYKFVGIAYSTYQMVFEPKPTLYYHDGSKLCILPGGSSVSVTQTLTSGTEIGSITVDGTETVLYAPDSASVTVDDAMSSTSTNPVQNAVIYSALSGKADSADIPTAVSELANDSGYITDAGVTSFNGSTGAVTYTAPVTSVNGSTGAVTVDVPTAVSELTNDAGYITDAGVTSFNGSTGAITYTAPVTSVNGSTGAVTVDVPTAVSELTNDSGYITDAGVTSFNGSTGAVTYTAPVTSVNGSTGAVTVDVPTAVSELTNDSGYITDAGVTSVNGSTGAVTIAEATTSAAGLMSAEDKTNLDLVVADYTAAIAALG